MVGLDLGQGLYLLHCILEEYELHGFRESLLLGGIPIVGSDLLLEVKYKGMCGAIPGAISKPSGCEIGEELGLFVLSYDIASIELNQCREDGLGIEVRLM